MSGLAIGLGGFMEGFTRGQQIKQGWEDDKRKKVLQERQDTEYNRTIEQRNAVDAVNKDARATFDQQVQSGTQKPDNFDQFWNKFALPKLKTTYLANGDLDNAKRVQDWGDSEDTKTGARLFAGALVKAQTGDSAGALSDVIEAGKIKGYINNGYEVLGQEPIVTPDGKSQGFRISLKMPDGKEVKQDIQSADLPKLISTFGNPEAAWNSQLAAQAAAAKDEKELSTYRDKKIIDKQFGLGDDKLRGGAITSLRKRMDGGLTGKDEKFDDLPADRKEKMISEELELQRGQPGLAGAEPAAPARTEKKVLVDTTTGKPVAQSREPAASASAAKPQAQQSSEPEAAAEGEKKPSWIGSIVTGLGQRASEGLQRERQSLRDSAARNTSQATTDPQQAAPDPQQVIEQADAALKQGVPAYDIAVKLQEAGVPEWKWPAAIQEQLRARQNAVGLNP